MGKRFLGLKTKTQELFVPMGGFQEKGRAQAGEKGMGKDMEQLIEKRKS